MVRAHRDGAGFGGGALVALDDETMVQPGGTHDGLSFAGTGVLDIVPFRIQGAYQPPADVEETGFVVARPPSFWVIRLLG